MSVVGELVLGVLVLEEAEQRAHSRPQRKGRFCWGLHRGRLVCASAPRDCSGRAALEKGFFTA